MRADANDDALAEKQAVAVPLEDGDADEDSMVEGEVDCDDDAERVPAALGELDADADAVVIVDALAVPLADIVVLAIPDLVDVELAVASTDALGDIRGEGVPGTGVELAASEALTSAVNDASADRVGALEIEFVFDGLCVGDAV